MSASTLYHFPDASTLGRYIANDPRADVCGFPKEDSYFCKIQEFAMACLPNTDKTEEELEALAQDFYQRLKGQKFSIVTPVNDPLPFAPMSESALVARIKHVLIEFSKMRAEEVDRVKQVRLRSSCDPSMSDLYIAADSGFIEEAKQLIAAQPELIHQTTGLGTSPLHIAVYKGHLDIVRALLEAGANLQAKDNKGLMPLDFAVKASLPSDDTHYDVLKTLLDEGKKRGLQIGEISASHLLFEACSLPKYWLISLLFTYGVEIEIQGYDSLKEVVKQGRNDIVELLLEKKIPVDPPVKEYQSALIAAVFCGHFDVFLTLLKAGAALDLQDEKGVAPLHIAALKGRMRFLEILIEKGANINIRDANGNAPIHYAMAGKQSEIITKLLALGVETHIEKK